MKRRLPLLRRVVVPGGGGEDAGTRAGARVVKDRIPLKPLLAIVKAKDLLQNAALQQHALAIPIRACAFKDKIGKDGCRNSRGDREESEFRPPWSLPALRRIEPRN